MCESGGQRNLLGPLDTTVMHLENFEDVPPMKFHHVLAKDEKNKKKNAESENPAAAIIRIFFAHMEVAGMIYISDICIYIYHIYTYIYIYIYAL